jgi:tetratricopeptide (TPR) repeat protein
MEERLGNKDQLSIRLYNLGVVYEAIDSLDLSYTYYYNSLLIEEQAGNPEGIFYALYGIAGVETKQGRFESAMTNLTRALSVARSINDVLGISVCHIELGKLYMAQDRFPLAIQAFDSSLYYSSPPHLLNEMKEGHLNLSSAWEELGDHVKAYHHLRHYVEINDSLNNLGIKSRIAELEARYEVDRKEEEIFNLRELNRLKTEKADSERRNRNFLLITVILAMILAIYNLRKISVDIKKALILAAGILGLMLLVSLALLYSGLYDHEASPGNFFMIFSDVLTFSVLPIFILIFFTERFLLNRYIRKAGVLTAQIQELNIPEKAEDITLQFEGKDASMTLPLNDLICFEAQDNYTAIYFRENGKLKKELKRVTMKKVEEQVSQTDEIVRCHKSYIINIKNVSHVSGNAQGYKLHLLLLEFSIPVSRKFPQSMIDKIRKG